MGMTKDKAQTEVVGGWSVVELLGLNEISTNNYKADELYKCFNIYSRTTD